MYCISITSLGGTKFSYVWKYLQLFRAMAALQSLLDSISRHRGWPAGLHTIQRGAAARNSARRLRILYHQPPYRNPYRSRQSASKPCLPISRCGNFSRAAGPRKWESRRCRTAGIHQTAPLPRPSCRRRLRAMRKLRWLPNCPDLKTRALLLLSMEKTVRKPLPAALQSHKLLQIPLLLLMLRGLPLAQTREPKFLSSQHPLCKRLRKLLPAMLHRLKFHLQSYLSLMSRRVLPGPILRPKSLSQRQNSRCNRPKLSPRPRDSGITLMTASRMTTTLRACQGLREDPDDGSQG
jgi:hypothetical protein